MTGPQLKRLLKAAWPPISQRAAARYLEINERTMRKYIAGDAEIPKLVELAIICLIQHKDGKP
jgi:hypothetical protein